MKNRLIKLTALLLVCASLFGCSGTKFLYDDSLYNSNGEYTPETSVLNGVAFEEDKTIYDKDKDVGLIYLYITMQSGVDTALGKTYDFDFLNNYTDSDLETGEDPYCDCIVREGSEKYSYGLSLFGFGETMANAQVRIKGNTTKIQPRSYQLKFYSRAGLWNGMNTVNLYKNLNDLSRMRQRFCFDAVSSISDIGSLRTGFVRLFVQDTNSDGELVYEDKGIYTYIEQPNKNYLSTHGLDTSGTLYRAKDFDFTRNADVLKSMTDETYDEAAFETVLNIRESTSHDEFLKMLDDVNNESIETSTIIKNYFNEDNLLTYAAISILFSNMSAYNDGYMLYSPDNSNTWYFIPSGFSDTLNITDGKNSQIIPSSIIGVGVLQNNLLFRRYFADKANIDKLKEKVDEIRQTIDHEYITEHTEAYKRLIINYLFSVPEITMLPRGAEYVEEEIDGFADTVEETYKLFAENIEKPYAPYVLSVTRDGVKGILTYELDTNDSDTAYYAEVSVTPTFDIIIATSLTTKTNTVTIEQLPDVTCYVRVVAIGSDGEMQYSSNIFEDIRGDTYYGCVVYENE